LGKDLIDDSAGSGVRAPDGPVLAPDMVEENDPIPKYSQVVKALEFHASSARISPSSFCKFLRLRLMA
jgi:hypothetical protein